MKIRFYAAAVCASIAIAAGVSLAQNFKKPQPHMEATDIRGASVTKSNIPREVWEQIDRQLAKGKVFEDQAHRFLEAGEYARAEEACAKAAEFYKGSPIEGRLKHLRGDIYFVQKKYETAKSIYEQGRKRSSKHPLPINMALCYVRLGDYNRAKTGFSVARLSNLYDIDPANLPAVHDAASLEGSLLLAKGLEYYFTAEPEKALVELQAASPLLPNNAATAYHIGMTLEHLKRFNEAAPYFATAARTGSGRLARSARSRWIALGGNASATAE